MEIKTAYRYAKIGPRKARLVIDLVRGMGVDEALNTLRLTRKRASSMTTKALRCAIAQAGELHSVDADDLYIKRAWVDAGPVKRWWWARPRGMRATKRHRTSHIHLILDTRE